MSHSDRPPVQEPAVQRLTMRDSPAPGTRRRPSSVSLLASELKQLFRRRRTQAMLLALAAIPVVIAVVVRDVAPRGVGILTTSPLAAGDTFNLVLPLLHALPDGADAITLECRALWRQLGSYGDGTSFVVGAEFLRRRM